MLIKCVKCNTKKDKAQFYKHPSTKTGRNSHCISCQAQGRKTEKVTRKTRVVTFNNTLAEILDL